MTRKLLNPPGAFKTPLEVQDYVRTRKGKLYMAPLLKDWSDKDFWSEGVVTQIKITRNTYCRNSRIYQVVLNSVWDGWNGRPLYVNLLELKGRHPTKVVWIAGPPWTKVVWIAGPPWYSWVIEACLFTNYWEAYAHALRWNDYHEKNAVHP